MFIKLVNITTLFQGQHVPAADSAVQIRRAIVVEGDNSVFGASKAKLSFFVFFLFFFFCLCVFYCFVFFVLFSVCRIDFMTGFYCVKSFWTTL